MRIKLAFIGILALIFILMQMIYFETAKAEIPTETLIFTSSDGFSPREDNVFVPSSYIRVYSYRPLVYNVNRIIAYDYIFMIKDPNGNPVHIQIQKDRSRSYAKETSAHFSKLIPPEWIDGEYTITIYTIDRVNPTYETKKFVTPIDPRMSDGEVSDLDKFFSTTDEQNLINNGLLKERQDSLVIEKELKFIIDSTAKPFYIVTLSVPEHVPPESDVKAEVILENTVNWEVTDSITPILNGKKISEVDFRLRPYETKKIPFDIIQSRPGNNTLELGTFMKSYEVEIIPLQPTEFIFNDLRVDKTKVQTGKEVNISVGAFNLGENGTVPVVLLLNDEVAATKNVTLEYGESTIVKFNLNLQAPGIYRANIQGKDFMKVIVVRDEVASEDEAESTNNKKFPVPFTSVAAAIFILWAAVYYLKYQRK